MQRLSEWKKDDNAARKALWVFAIGVTALAIFGDSARAGTSCEELTPLPEIKDSSTCESDTEEATSEPTPRVVISTRVDDERLHKLAEQVLNVVCKDTSCRNRRVFNVIQGVSELLEACNAQDVNERWCLSLIVTATYESGFRLHPGCGVSEDCAATCDQLDDGPKRNRCLVDCAKQEGASTLRARACNDRGTSRGPFQMKPSTAAKCHGSPHDWYQAGSCYLDLVKSSMGNAYSRCGTDKPIWMVAWKRVGVGPFERGTREPTCSVSSYALRAMNWNKTLGGN